MSDTFNIKIGNDPENIYDAYPTNNEFKNRAGGWPSDLPKPSNGGYGYNTTVKRDISFSVPGFGFNPDEDPWGSVSYSDVDIEIPEVLKVGKKYSVTINGVTDDYICFADEFGDYCVGYKYPQGIGFWQCYTYKEEETGETYMGFGVIGNVGEIYDFSISVEQEIDVPIDGRYLPIGEVSDLHITRVEDQKILTPFGAGYIPFKIHSDAIWIEAIADGETTWGDSLAPFNLIPGETYEVSVNGVTNTYICQIEGDRCYIGTPMSKMDFNPSIGDWQFVSYDGEDNLYCNVCGHEGDTFEFVLSGIIEERSLIPSDWVESPDIPDFSSKMDANNPVGTGSFSLNRRSGTIIGDNSFAEGFETTASGLSSHAEGESTKSSGRDSHAEGLGSTASGDYSHAEGTGTTASSDCSHSEGGSTTASGYCSHVEGWYTRANGDYSHVQGKYNVIDSNNRYADIVGWGTGTSTNARKNISSLTTTGDLHLAGDVYVGANADGTGGTARLSGGAIYVQAADDATKMMKITVNSDGTISATQVTA